MSALPVVVRCRRGTPAVAQAGKRMDQTTSLVLATFLAVYIGMALGRWPGLKIDRTGIAVLGAIVLYSSGVVSNAEVLQAVDFPTLIVLFGLMVLSAQFGACGFYDWCSARIAATHASPNTVLASDRVRGRRALRRARQRRCRVCHDADVDHGLAATRTRSAALSDCARQRGQCGLGRDRYRQPAEHPDRPGRTARLLGLRGRLWPAGARWLS